MGAEVGPDGSWDVLVETLEDDAFGLNCLGLSSLGTLGPPAREQATPCLVQLAHGASSLHCESEPD